MALMWITVLLFTTVVSAVIVRQEIAKQSLTEGDDETERVVGGQPADQEMFPWTVALYNEDNFICTASIISPFSVLTAAHCVVFNRVVQPVKSFNGLIGDVNRTSLNAQQIYFKRIIAHPDYDNLQSDLAILETTEPMQFNNRIQPICIANTKIGRLILKSVLAMGWGQVSTENDTNPEVLHYTKQRVVSNLKCSILYLGRKTPENTLCASGLYSGVCYGDSGGPLVFKQGKQPIQVGIASFVNSLVGCGTKLGPAGFTRLSYFTDFIVKNAKGKVCVA
ncbi:suppressor of tumorigenicity 14 protein [Trichonephila clavipes]|uniref:Suppressor of tumorigenicity 14 protein n=1 Tax=Trichonephila clavipes TaxID=2585209 RepID=A0A8X6RJW4_TRICX|nr:suppressor of tumorigenicity 14 protein [Trichonephila clavipes]